MLQLSPLRYYLLSTDLGLTTLQAINNDASDPDLDAAYNARLSQIGPVQPSPTMSNSSTFNTSASTYNPSLSPSHQSSHGNFQPSASSPSQSIFPSVPNPAIAFLQARERLAQEAEEEFENLGRRGAAGRRFLDVVTIRQVLMMRDELRKGAEEIETQLGLQKGVVRKMGPRGVVSGAGA